MPRDVASAGRVSGPVGAARSSAAVAGAPSRPHAATAAVWLTSATCVEVVASNISRHMLPSYQQLLAPFRVGADKLNSVFYVPDYLTPEEEAALLRQVYACQGKWTQVWKSKGRACRRRRRQPTRRGRRQDQLEQGPPCAALLCSSQGGACRTTGASSTRRGSFPPRCLDGWRAWAAACRRRTACTVRPVQMAPTTCWSMRMPQARALW